MQGLFRCSKYYQLLFVGEYLYSSLIFMLSLQFSGYFLIYWRFFSFSTLSISFHFSLLVEFYMRDMLYFLYFFLYLRFCFFLSTLSTKYRLALVILITVCLDVVLLEYILFGTLGASWIRAVVSITENEKILSYLFLSTSCSALLPFSSPDNSVSWRIKLFFSIFNVICLLLFLNNFSFDFSIFLMTYVLS